MSKKYLKPYPLVYLMALFFGLLLIFFIFITFLKFSSGNFIFGFSLVFISFLFLSSFVAWVQKVEDLKLKEKSEKKVTNKSFYKGRIE
jgi:hypothetical protein